MLRWQNQWGTHLRSWQKIYDEGREPPRQFYEQPEVRSDLQGYWIAFNDLSTERQIGMGIGPIPRSKIKSYGRDDLGITEDDDLDRFCAVIRRMDDEYVRFANSSSNPGETKPREIPVDDVEGVKSLFHDIGARKEATRKKKTKT